MYFIEIRRNRFKKFFPSQSLNLWLAAKCFQGSGLRNSFKFFKEDSQTLLFLLSGFTNPISTTQVWNFWIPCYTCYLQSEARWNMMVMPNVKKMLEAATYSLYHNKLLSKFLKNFQGSKFRNIGKFRKTHHPRGLLSL